jgi:hypothetical protein
MMTCVDALAEVSDQSRASLSVRVGRDRLAAGLALAAFAVLCVMSLSFAPKLVEPDGELTVNADVVTRDKSIVRWVEDNVRPPSRRTG